MNFLRNTGGDQRLTAYILIAPALILLVIFMIVPFVRGIQLSMTNQQFTGAEADNVGLENYDQILSIGLMKLPPKPEIYPESRPSIGWYQNDDGEALFRWRTRAVDESLDEIYDGLERYRDFEIASIVNLFGTEYGLMMKEPLFWTSMRNNIFFALVVVPVQTSLALFLAILINQKLPYMNVFRTTYFSPVVTAMVIIAVVWSFLYNPQFGLINEMIGVFGLGPYDWLQDPQSAMPAIIIMSIWQGVGFQMVIFLAGLQDIPEDLYEAAGIDGASIWQKFRYVTLPMLRNTTVFVVLTTTILAFRLFDQVNVMTPDGGPENSTATMVWYAIRRGWGNGEIGYASAVSVVFVAIVLIISMIQRLIVRSESALD